MLRLTMSLLFVSLLCGAALLASAAEPADEAPPTPKALLVDDFDGGIQNVLGGYRSTYEAAPSSAKSTRANKVFRGPTGKSLRIDVSREEAGFCGAWIHFFDMRARQPQYLDARDYAYLSFWVRGEQGGETFDVQLADEKWIGKQDSVRLGEIADFLPGGVTNQWQEALVPLRRGEGLDLQKLGGLTLNFRSPGTATVYIDDVSFKQSADAEVVATVSEPEPATEEPKPKAAGVLPRAIWVWTTKIILDDAAKSRELLEFCQQEEINQLWMQLDYKIEPGGLGTGRKEARCVIAHEEKWRSFLREAHERKIRVDALDGAPEYAIKEQHHVPLAVVDGVIRFNAAGPREERFDGVHFDNEPYLLLGWEDQDLREKILREFLELNTECQRRVAAARTSKDEFRFGVDIPFWWQEREDPLAPFPGDVTFGGLRQPASFHCLDLLDVVGIMNYRDTADGPDGMIFHGRGILEHKDGQQRAAIYMGIETITAEPAEVQFVTGLPREQFRSALRGDARRFASLCRLSGLRLHRFDDGQNVHIGIEHPANATAVQKNAALEALAEIAEHLSIGAQSNSPEQVESAHTRVANAIAKSSEWQSFTAHDVKLLERSRTIPGFTAKAVMPPKCTFAEETPAELRLQTGLAEKEFATYPAYRGLAVHSYESYRPKVAEEKSPQPARAKKRAPRE